MKENKNTQSTPVLTIAGSDPSGGAGLQADLKSFSAMGVYGMTAVTALTVGNTQGVRKVLPMEPDFVLEQIQTISDDIAPLAIKTGLLANESITRCMAEQLRGSTVPVVVDPVIATKRGDILLSDEGIEAYRRHLIPYSNVVTPNIPEAEQLTGIDIPSFDAMPRAARKILETGCGAVVIKGGYFDDWEYSNDLFYDGETMVWLRSKRLHTKHVHGSGDAFSAVIAAELAEGKNLKSAIERAKKFVLHAIKSAPGLGSGEGPINYDRYSN